jgi:hypothetical protein
MSQLDPELSHRFDQMLHRLAEAYDAIGHSSGRPYLYFVYPPEQELEVRRKVAEQMVDNGDLGFVHIDLVRLTGDSVDGQEEKRTKLLAESDGAKASLMRMWARRLADEIRQRIQAIPPPLRPVVVLLGTAALYPLGNPTALMESVAENEIRSPQTNQVVPVVLFVPGRHVPDASRTYLFLGRDDQRLSFYRGEEI